VPCTIALRDNVRALCARHDLAPSALAWTALALVAERPDLARPDPGPGMAERVQVVLDSGKTRIMHFLPRLRLHLPRGTTLPQVRGALATILAHFEPAAQGGPDQEVIALREEVARLRDALEHLAPPLLPQPPSNATQAAWLMGFANEWGLSHDKITARYRQLARIYHPDSGVTADNNRMAQLTAARVILMRHAKA
jgi:hypothetical protein